MKHNLHFLSYLSQFFIEREMFQIKFVEKIIAYILCSFFSENRTAYEIMWKSNVQSDRPQMTIWCMRIACWIPKATNTHWEYVIHIAFPLQQWLHERATMLHYTYIACLVWPLSWKGVNKKNLNDFLCGKKIEKMKTQHLTGPRIEVFESLFYKQGWNCKFSAFFT